MARSAQKKFEEEHFQPELKKLSSLLDPIENQLEAIRDLMLRLGQNGAKLSLKDSNIKNKINPSILGFINDNFKALSDKIKDLMDRKNKIEEGNSSNQEVLMGSNKASEIKYLLGEMQLKLATIIPKDAEINENSESYEPFKKTEQDINTAFAQIIGDMTALQEQFKTIAPVLKRNLELEKDIQLQKSIEEANARVEKIVSENAYNLEQIKIILKNFTEKKEAILFDSSQSEEEQINTINNALLYVQKSLDSLLVLKKQTEAKGVLFLNKRTNNPDKDEQADNQRYNDLRSAVEQLIKEWVKELETIKIDVEKMTSSFNSIQKDMVSTAQTLKKIDLRTTELDKIEDAIKEMRNNFDDLSKKYTPLINQRKIFLEKITQANTLSEIIDALVITKIQSNKIPLEDLYEIKIIPEYIKERDEKVSIAMNTRTTEQDASSFLEIDSKYKPPLYKKLLSCIASTLDAKSATTLLEQMPPAKNKIKEEILKTLNMQATEAVAWGLSETAPAAEIMAKKQEFMSLDRIEKDVSTQYKNEIEIALTKKNQKQLFNEMKLNSLNLNTTAYKQKILCFMIYYWKNKDDAVWNKEKTDLMDKQYKAFAVDQTPVVILELKKAKNLADVLNAIKLNEEDMQKIAMIEKDEAESIKTEMNAIQEKMKNFAEKYPNNKTLSTNFLSENTPAPVVTQHATPVNAQCSDQKKEYIAEQQALQQNLAAKSIEIEQKQIALQAANQEINHCTIKSKEHETALQNALITKDGALEQTKQAIAQCEIKTIAQKTAQQALQQNLAAQSSEITQKDIEIQKATKKEQEYKSLIKEKEDKLKELDTDIESKENAIIEKSTLIEEQDRVIEEKNIKIKRKDEYIQKANRLIKRLKIINGKKNRLILTQTKELEALKKPVKQKPTRQPRPTNKDNR